MGTEYLELFNEAIDNLRTSTGNDLSLIHI